MVFTHVELPTLSLAPPAFRSKAKKQKDRVIEDAARTTLLNHPHFRGRGDWIRCQVQNRCLKLEGYLPSFFLKQLAQEAVRSVEGIERIDNQIVVASPVGDVFDPDLRDRSRHLPR